MWPGRCVPNQQRSEFRPVSKIILSITFGHDATFYFIPVTRLEVCVNLFPRDACQVLSKGVIYVNDGETRTFLCSTFCPSSDVEICYSFYVNAFNLLLKNIMAQGSGCHDLFRIIMILRHKFVKGCFSRLLTQFSDSSTHCFAPFRYSSSCA